jgi:hypothetical protein
MPKKKVRYRRAGVMILVFAGIVAAMGYGIAQSTVVTQAEWAVYMVRALSLDWNLPDNPKSNHYIGRLNWQAGIEVAATGFEPGSSPFLTVDSGYVQAEGPDAEAIYRVSTIRPGDYAFRLKLANGGALVKIGTAVFDAFQPGDEFGWVDFRRISLDPGDHTVSVLLSEGARAEMLGVTPPCLISVEPKGGWAPLEPLTYGDFAVTLAKALELEYALPGTGPETEIKGEDFTRVLEIPLEEEVEESVEPFWLSSGGSLLTARARFVADQSGLYAIEARYFSPGEVRWTVDGCLRAITCPVQVGETGLIWTSVVALKLDAGEHDLGLTLPPHASLDQVTIQRKEESIDEYMGAVTEEGFRMQGATEQVSRRRAISAAIRLRSLFERWKASRCKDTVIALEKLGALLMAGARRDADAETRGLALPGLPGDNVPRAAPDPESVDGRNPVLPTGEEPPVASPLKPSGG